MGRLRFKRPNEAPLWKCNRMGDIGGIIADHVLTWMTEDTVTDSVPKLSLGHFYPIKFANLNKGSKGLFLVCLTSFYLNRLAHLEFLT